MPFLKLLSIFLLSIDAYIGIRFFLNVVNLLQTTKYSQTATLIYAIVFTGLSVAGFYALFVSNNLKLSLWISLAPWVLILLFLFLNMIFGDYK